MSTSTLGLFLRRLALSEEVGRLGSVGDHNLLAAYESGRGQAAFAELMRRHGPMVLRTCLRVLGQESDAEDAFQATFVLLARKAGSISKREALGGWLHRVAHRTALDVLAKSARRRIHERQAGAMTHSAPDPLTKATWNEVQPILDAELDALPGKSRLRMARVQHCCWARCQHITIHSGQLPLRLRAWGGHTMTQHLPFIRLFQGLITPAKLARRMLSVLGCP